MTWMVKNLPAMQETWAQSLGQEMGTAIHSSILAWEIQWTEVAGYSPWGHKELDTTEQLTLFCFFIHIYVCVGVYIYIYFFFLLSFVSFLQIHLLYLHVMFKK